RLLVRVKTIGMVNILAGRKIVPELVQGKLYIDNLLRELETYLTDAAVRERVKGELMRVREMLGSSGASGRVANTILQWNENPT
ncbi:MAG: lipid-A-disaccharide synthase, partial [Bacteroidota bacterium]